MIEFNDELDWKDRDTSGDEAARSLLDQLLANSRLYKQSKDYKELLNFAVRLRNFAPFNAMLLQIQKPGLTYAASDLDWRTRFGRKPKEEARPLLILWPFCPVALVYDVLDTEGAPLPEDVAAFFAQGDIDEERMASFLLLLQRKKIELVLIDAGDGSAGSISINKDATEETGRKHYRMRINRNHSLPVQFNTWTHELGHLFLGHLGLDKTLKIPSRTTLSHVQEEIEAESVAFIVCCRNGIVPKSQVYLSRFISDNITTEDIDIYQIMRAAGQVEGLLELTAPTKFDKPKLGS